MSAAETETAAAPKPKRKRRPHHVVIHIDLLARENAKFRAAQTDREMSRAARLKARDRAYAAALAANGITAERVEARPDGRTVRTRGYCAGCAFASSRRAVLPTDAPVNIPTAASVRAFAKRRREAAPCA